MSDNMKEFKENLFNKVDMMQPQNRFITDVDAMAPTLGMLKSLDKFDAGFFKIAPTLANMIDPQQRLLLEVVFEALIDSGTLKYHAKFEWWRQKFVSWDYCDIFVVFQEQIQMI